MSGNAFNHAMKAVGLLIMWFALPQGALASTPNVVLSQAVHFSAPDGNVVTVSPGQYLVEQTGGGQLRLVATQSEKAVEIKAEVLTHEQYELFTAMAMTRPGKEGRLYIDLLLPGGTKLEAMGSIKAPPTVASTTPAPTQPHPLPTETVPQPEIPTQPDITIEQVKPLSEAPAPPLLAYVPPTPRSPGPRVNVVNLGNENDLPDLFVLAPDHIGLTVYEQPTLYWYVSKPIHHPVDVVITEVGDLRVMFDFRLLPPIQAGLHDIGLKDFGIRLLQNVPYHWEVKIMAGTPGGAMTASGFIKRVPPPSSLSPITPGLTDSGSPEAYAQASLWYDAFGALSELIRAHPNNESFLQQRAALLEQVGMADLLQ
jgi:hypothetical protein